MKMADSEEKSYAWPESNCNESFNEETSSKRTRKHEMALQLGPKDGSFAVDPTSTPNRLIRYAEEVGLFQDLQNVNPFEETFKRASEARSGNNCHLTVKNQLPNGNDDTLHTPQIFPHLPDDSPNNLFVCKPDNINLALDKSKKANRSESSTDKCPSDAEGVVASATLHDKEICDISNKEKLSSAKNDGPLPKSSKLKLIGRDSIAVDDNESSAILKMLSEGSTGDGIVSHRGVPKVSESAGPIGGKVVSDSGTARSIGPVKKSLHAGGEEFQILLKLPDGKELHFKASGDGDGRAERERIGPAVAPPKPNGVGVKRKLKDFVRNNLSRGAAPPADLAKKVPIRPLNSPKTPASNGVVRGPVLGLNIFKVVNLESVSTTNSTEGRSSEKSDISKRKPALEPKQKPNPKPKPEPVSEESKRADLHERNKAAQLRYRARKRKTFELTLKKNKKLEAENRLLAEKLSVAMREIERLNALLRLERNSSKTNQN